MIFRRLKKTDYIEYLQLISMFRETYFTEEQFITTLNHIESANSEIWVLCLDNDKLIGTGTLLFENKFIHNISKIAHIEDICVDSSYRGQGYGTKLIDFLIEHAKTKGCYKITLYCKEELEKFYELNGLKRNSIQMALYM